jgi:hypothetical protein
VCETGSFSVVDSWPSHQSPDRKAESQLYLSEKVAAQEKEVIETALRECQGRAFGPSGARREARNRAVHAGIENWIAEDPQGSLQIMIVPEKRGHSNLSNCSGL